MRPEPAVGLLENACAADRVQMKHMIHVFRGAALAGLLSVGLAGSAGYAQQPAHLPRLPLDVLNVRPPSDRVAGEPGTMRVAQAGCAGAPAAINAGLRQRIVDITVQEWAFFGFGVVDQTMIEPSRAPTVLPSAPASSRGPGHGRRGRARISATESARVAPSIAGYWTVTAEGGWIIDQQNGQWNSRAGGNWARAPGPTATSSSRSLARAAEGPPVGRL